MEMQLCCKERGIGKRCAALPYTFSILTIVELLSKIRKIFVIFFDPISKSDLNPCNTSSFNKWILPNICPSPLPCWAGISRFVSPSIYGSNLGIAVFFVRNGLTKAVLRIDIEFFFGDSLGRNILPRNHQVHIIVDVRRRHLQTVDFDRTGTFNVAFRISKSLQR